MRRGMVDVPPDLDNASHEDLKELVQTLLERVNAALRDENARLKGKPPRPDVKPSGMAEKAQSRGASKAKAKSKKPGRGSKRSRLRIDEDRHLQPADLPNGSRFKGYQDHLVQELVIRARTVRYRRERWLTPNGRTVTAELPGHVQGHYGGDLRRLIVTLYHRGQMTIPRITTQLRDLGVDIDRRQVRRLLDDTDAEAFLTEAQDVLHAGLATAAWVSVDDTGARHQARNGYCTQIGDDRFTAFLTRFSKSRQNFLELLRAGHTDYVVNAEALAYMRGRNLSQAVIDQLAEGPTYFPDAASWQAHLSALGLDQAPCSLTRSVSRQRGRSGAR
ncbi:IS66 family transposase [Rhodovibrio sodomensis]|uniref:IS66 family transposase n=1 Tax=Rhodovibrio sodomensis TaxID=1088 RepID=UPI001906EC4D|nr:transposase [Rhodovibrio sodomensis]